MYLSPPYVSAYQLLEKKDRRKFPNDPCTTVHVVSAQNWSVAIRANDGVSPFDDGQTQEGKTISITCVYNSDGLLWFQRPMIMEVEKYGVISPVATMTTLSETFNDPSKYSITRVVEGAYATKFEIKGV